MSFRSVSPLAVIAALGICTSAVAQDEGGRDGWSVGAIGIVSVSPYEGDDTQTILVPNVAFRSGPLSFSARGINYTAYEGSRDSIDLFLASRFEPYDSSDSPALTGLDRDFSLDLGLAYSLTLNSGTVLRAAVQQEVTGEHDGQEVDFRLSQRLGTRSLPVGVFAGATWRSEDLSNFLYGVGDTEAIAGRPAFDTGATVSPYIGVGTRVPLGDSFSLTGSLRAEYLGRDIRDSPIIDNSTTISATLGLTFDF